MSRTRLALAAVVAAAALLPATAASAEEDNCVTHPENCYECVMYPCYPRDWPPFLLEKVEELLRG